MHTQVITIQPGGIMSGLQRKPGQGLDLRQFGKAEIKRASLIEWDADRQAWFIDVLQTAGRGTATLASFQEATSTTGCATERVLDDLCIAGLWDASHDGVLRFEEYDDAVRVEIAYLDALRLKGHY